MATRRASALHLAACRLADGAIRRATGHYGSGSLLAVGADAEDIETVVGDLETQLFGDDLLPLLNSFVQKLFHFATLHAKDMIVMATLIEFKHRVSTLKMVATHDIRRLKLRQDTVNRGQANILTGFQQRFVDVFGTHMVRLAALQNIENLDARQRRLEPGFFQVLGCSSCHITHETVAVSSSEINLSRTKMQKIIIYFALSLVIGVAGCAHKPDLQQGNILTQAELSKLEQGMTKRQVLFLLGSPLLTDPFHQQRWDYYYSYKPGGEEITTRYQVTVWFKDDRLVRYSSEGDIPEEVPLAPRLKKR